MLALVRDLPGVTARILALRQALPSLDLSALLAQYPWWAAAAIDAVSGGAALPTWHLGCSAQRAFNQGSKLPPQPAGC